MLNYPFRFPKEKAIFLERINRFVIKVRLKNKEVFAYLPNPGRLWELLLPETEVLLKKNSGKNRLSYTVLACKKENTYVLLHTHLTNKIIKKLIEEKKLAIFKGWRVIKEEPVYGASRFDLLLERIIDQKRKLLEIKTCTLFGKKIAMFPDAETKRGKKHLLDLGELTKKGKDTCVLFAVMHPEAEYFLPAYHIDMEFTKAFLKIKDLIEIKAISLEWDREFKEVVKVKELKIPFDILKKEAGNRGAYLLILKVDDFISVKGWELRAGFYVYVGSGKKNLDQRIKRHLRKNKKNRWHIDYLIEKAKIIKVIPIRTSEDLECRLAEELKKLSEASINGFGCSDCRCRSHLFYFSQDPIKSSEFQKFLVFYRIDRLCSYLK